VIATTPTATIPDHSGAQQPLVAMRGIAKQFPGVVALSHVDLDLAAGELLAVIGENGAGKSTLMKILAGVETADQGEIRIRGVPVRLDSIATAQRHGIALIHQELNLATNLDVGANIVLGREPRRWGLVDRQATRRISQRVLDVVGLDVSPDLPVGSLSIGQQQLVEIAKALSSDVRVLIMDEPTSSLTAHEAARLFQAISDLKSRGVGIVYISHRLAEVSQIADRVMVLRDGRVTGTLERQDIHHEQMVMLMVGRTLGQFYVRKTRQAGAVSLSVRNLRTATYPRHAVSFDVRAGEVVGVAGLVGAGRTELLRVIFGIDRPVDGEVYVGTERLPPLDPRRAIRAGVALVPEDRKHQGLILQMSVRENLSLAALRRDCGWGGWLRRAAEGTLATELVDELSIKTPHVDQGVELLSGGNQQKVVLAKWLALRPRVLLLDEPTRGVDISAKHEIYALIDQLARDGVAILLVSSELEEILGMSDRCLVMHEGRLVGQPGRDELTEQHVMRLATGGRTSAAMAATH
jgi:ribose transport system ATP-binding protein